TYRARCHFSFSSGFFPVEFPSVRSCLAKQQRKSAVRQLQSAGGAKFNCLIRRRWVVISVAKKYPIEKMAQTPETPCCRQDNVAAELCLSNTSLNKRRHDRRARRELRRWTSWVIRLR